MVPTQPTVIPRATRHGLGVAAISLAIATPVVAVIGWVWAALTPGMAALAVGMLALCVVAIVAVSAIVVGLVSLGMSTPNSLAKLSLLLVASTALVLVMLIFPPTQWFT